jgi:hypothetical protein
MLCDPKQKTTKVVAHDDHFIMHPSFRLLVGGLNPDLHTNGFFLAKFRNLTKKERGSRSNKGIFEILKTNIRHILTKKT